MNFLAHLFLSCQEADLLIGNFIADSIRKKEMNFYPKSIQKGILLHRRIDSFTDKHDKVRVGVRRLYPLQGKYAPVVIDIFYDYLLSNNWATYSEESLTKFSKRMYRLLEQRISDLPTALQQNVPTMIRHDWLMRYGTEDGLRFVFQGMKKRVKFPNQFDHAVDHLLQDHALFDEEFNAFFPDVIQMVEDFCGC